MIDPDLIETTKGPLPVTSLEKREGADETDNEIARWVEYWLDGELVHRSVAVQLKRWPAGLEAFVQDLG